MGIFNVKKKHSKTAYIMFFLRHNKYMTISKAISLRIKELLKEKNMTLYKLEKNSGILHGTMSNIMYGRNKGVTLRVIIQIAQGFEMSYHDFLNSPLLDEDNFNLD